MKTSVDPDQLASEEASWSGSTLFLKKSGYIVLKKLNTLHLLGWIWDG